MSSDKGAGVRVFRRGVVVRSQEGDGKESGGGGGATRSQEGRCMEGRGS